MKTYTNTEDRLLAVAEQPATRAENYGFASLNDSELLAILLGGKKCRVFDTAREIMHSADYRLCNIKRKDIKELSCVKGVGKHRVCLILAAFELGKRFYYSQKEMMEQNPLTMSRKVAKMFIPLLSDLPHEEFWVVFVNHSNKIICKKRISTGGVHMTYVDPKMIFKDALLNLATGVFLIHNHPSGNTSPSEIDITLTDKIREGAETLDLRVLDHIIVSGNEYFSFNDHGYL